MVLMRFVKDGQVFDGCDHFFGTGATNWWVSIYVGPWWNYPFYHEDKCYGTTATPLEGLVTCKRILRYFIDNIMGPRDVLEISGTTEQRDIIYYRSLKGMGFRFTEEYNECEHILIYTRDDAGWDAIINNDVPFTDTPCYLSKDYEFDNISIFSDAIRNIIRRCLFMT
jgi:hypothetical protein